MDGLSQVIWLVHLGDGPTAMQAEDGEDQQRFENGLAAGHLNRVLHMGWFLARVARCREAAYNAKKPADVLVERKKPWARSALA